MEEEDQNLTKRAKKFSIDPDDPILDAAFSEKFKTFKSILLPSENKFGQVIFTQLSRDEGKILCGSNKGIVTEFDLDDKNLIDKVKNLESNISHNGLTGVRYGNLNENIFYTSGNDGYINCWDNRAETSKPSIKFSLDLDLSKTFIGDQKLENKPILTLDISANDQILVGGTEQIDEESHLLFWDPRSNKKILNIFSDCHSDDITTVKFHPNSSDQLISGSTDGLINIFNSLDKLESLEEEDDALFYSLNTESSVENLFWIYPELEDILCITHSNELQIWNGTTADKIADYSHEIIENTFYLKEQNQKEAEGENNDKSVSFKKDCDDEERKVIHVISDCYKLNSNENGSESIGILTSSLSGGLNTTRILQLKRVLIEENSEGNDIFTRKLEPKGLLLNQYSIVQSAQFLQKENRWITFDDEGYMKIWTLQNEDEEMISEIPSNSKIHSLPKMNNRKRKS